MSVLSADVTSFDQLQEKLRAHGQEHLLAFWDELDDAGRGQLAGQINNIDFDLVASLFRGEVEQPDWAALSAKAEPPPAVRLADRKANAKSGLGFTPEEAKLRGKSALATGEMGVLLVAGGQGSRLGFEKPKSLYPIGPLSEATLLQIHIEKVRALSRQYGKPIPLYLMTSPVTHEDTVEFVEKHHRFGLTEDDLVIFCQGTMPAVDDKKGKVLMSAKDELFLSPNGHGGTVAALADSGAIEHMHRHGVKQLFYFQVDNPLAPICDEELIGSHLLAESELTSLTIAKQTPEEKLGNFVLVDDALHVIEYSDFPESIAQQQGADGGLKFWAGSIAIHVFDVAFLERSLKLKDSLPFHTAHKQASFLDESGKLLEPEEKNALKFERFIFDLLPQAKRPIVVEFAEREVFAPLKNAPGAPKDTPKYVQQYLLDQHRRWLTAAGAKVADGVDVEISPLVAHDAAAVAKLVEAGQEFNESQYLSEA
ncbi:UTP--glucose-1-phosphate uridylyltransferase [Adhaeretor mobilis]|uniref:Putative uridylyltransferase n=1 Tax=Adhaeretor mobilis TaxID=1930276 RepID=A0A517N222_9BACT|nr:UTP--glucose-1-phosphate uridylyltransferase [Adhaeretor mobilis]QDT01187.1 putative uridylyltransferase [Adhaeretor mobilis]